MKFYNRIPVFHSNGEQRRDYIYIDDLIDLALLVRDSSGFDCVNVASNKNYSVNEIFSIVRKLMGKDILARYANTDHYWYKYPELYKGVYPIKSEILNHEVNKYSLCDNSYAREKYGWSPKVDMEEGLQNVIKYEVKLLSRK